MSKILIDEAIVKLALDDLIAEYYMENSSFAKRVDEIFKEALAEPQQDPVAWADMSNQDRDVGLSWTPGQFHAVPPYTSPPAQPLPFGVGGGLVAIKTLLSRDPCAHANTAIQMIDAILAEHPAQRKPLTVEEIEVVWKRVQANDFHDCVQPFARGVEAAHGIKGDA